jgi:hypothetical protein
MAIEFCLICPLGVQDCEYTKDGKNYRCRWYVPLAGKDPQSGEMIDEWKCAIAWGPIMSVEIANTNRGQTSAIESLRNETVNQAQTTNAILFEAAQKSRMANDNNLLQ